MFCFKIWGKFAAFRDPLTITQNLTLPIPPKTTIGGMMAAILGIDYHDYFNDPDYFDFKYSLISENKPRKKSFTQNYIMDYTSRSKAKFDKIKGYFFSADKLNKLEQERERLLNLEERSKSEEKKFIGIDQKIDKAKKDFSKRYNDYHEDNTHRFPKSKPIFRELLLNPEYLIFIDDFKYEAEIIQYLKDHSSAYQLYLGNTEFAGNYLHIPIEEYEKQKLDKLNSFTVQPDLIKFELGKQYTPVYAATKVVNDREYRDYQKIILCDQEICLKNSIDGYSIKTEYGVYYCEFI